MAFFRHECFTSAILYFILFSISYAYDSQEVTDYEQLTRSNFVARPEDKNISFIGNETFLPQSFMFDALLVNSSTTNATVADDPFLDLGIGRQLSDSNETVYEANWKSLDKRVPPTWYDEAKVGVFIHWGVYSVPSYGSSNQYDGYAEWFLYEWKGRKNSDFINFMEANYPKDFQYQDFVPFWKGELFNPDDWAELIEKSGAKYFVMTTKHHDGYTLWQSNQSKFWNSVESGPRRDIIGELAEAFEKKEGVHFGLYYSLYEWFHPLYLRDKKNDFKSQEFVEKIMKPQMHDYVTRYKPEYIWSDGDWETSDEYWNSTEFLAWLYNESPVRDVVLVNDRWGVGTACKHGDVKTCGIDRYNPKEMTKFKWENAMTIDKHSWGYRRNAKLEDYYSMDELIGELAETISLGGNILMNVGPNADGSIAPIFQERLIDMGKWLKVNGEGIYGTKTWRAQNDTSDRRVWYTAKDELVYAIVLDWPVSRIVTLIQPVPTAKTKVHLLGLDNELIWAPLTDNWGLKIDVTNIGPSNLPSEHAWIFRLSDVS